MAVQGIGDQHKLDPGGGAAASIYAHSSHAPYVTEVLSDQGDEPTYLAMNRAV